MKYNEETFRQKVDSLYNKEIEVVSRYKGLTHPLLIKDLYGVMRVDKAVLVLNNRPGIKAALNKTLYFMTKLSILHPEIASLLIPQSEYIAAKKEMLFLTRFGVISTTPDTLLAGHMPGIQAAINRKEYFKNQLLAIYGDLYDFKVSSTSRHEGRVILICPIHGEVSVDTDTIFTGSGCPKCNTGGNKSDLLYFIELCNNTEMFYKIGVAHYDKNGNIKRFRDYKRMGYNVKIIKLIKFPSYEEAHAAELKLRAFIKPFLYTPKNWVNLMSYECFLDTKEAVLHIINNDIVSTSVEIQSSLILDGLEVAIPTEDNEV